MSQTQVQTTGITDDAVTAAKINFETALVPIGGIIMWSGSTVTIPTGYRLCNGSNGTPNLQDKFIVGAGSGYAVAATGGSANATLVSHSHGGSIGAVGDHTHGYTAHNMTGGTSGGSNTARAQFTASTGGAGGHSHTLTIDSAGSSGTNANLPPYYALAFIMRVS